MASSSSSSSSPPVSPHHRLNVSELCRLLQGEKEQCRVWFRDELHQIPDPLISSLFARLIDSLSSWSSSSVGSQSRLTVSELCQLLEGVKEQVRKVLQGEMDRLTNTLFGRLTNKLSTNEDWDREDGGGERAQVVDRLDQVESANPLSVQPSQPNPQPTTSFFNHEADQRHSNGDEVKVNTVEMIKEEEEEEDGEMIEIKQEFKEEEEEDDKTINKVVKMEIKEEEDDCEIESNQVIDHENTEEGTFKYPTLSQPNQHFINTDSSNQQPNEPMHFDPISHQPTTIQSFVQSTSSPNQMQINFASLSTQLESTANAPPVPSVLAQCLPSVSQPNAQVELGSDLDQDLYRRPESMFVAIKVEVETTPTEGDEPNEAAIDAQNQSQTTKQAKTRKRKSLTTESCSLENSSTSHEVSSPGPKKRSKQTRVSRELDRPETVEEVSAAVGVDLSEVDEENGEGEVLGQIDDDKNETEFAEEDGGHYMIEVVKLKCTEVNCEEEFASRDELNGHLRDKHHTSPYRCLAEGCFERFEQWSGLGRHVNHNHSNISIWSCAHCTKTFNTHHLLYNHLYWHHFEGQFKCGYDGCDYDRVATLRSEIRAHQLSDHPKTTIFTCQFNNCGKSFNLKGNFEVHQRTHTGFKPYPCDWPRCGKSFTQQSTLKGHQRIHQNVKPFKCTWNMCGYASTQQGTVIQHIRTQHFNLPATQKEQRQLNIEDNRNPRDFLQVEQVNPSV